MTNAVNTQDLKSRINLLAIIGQDTNLRKVASTRGGEYAGPCPFCGGQDRFHVQPMSGLWMCRFCSEKWSDVIGYVMKRDNCDFKTAVEVLDGQKAAAPVVRSLAGLDKKPFGPPSAQWQEAARKIGMIARANLWSSEGQRALDWLHNRGLTDDTIARYGLGYWPKDEPLNAADFGLEKVWIDRGITIPGGVGYDLWYIKVRRPVTTEKPKYRCVTGSEAVALFGGDNLRSGRADGVGMLFEGEFDAMLADQLIGDAVGCATLGSCTNWNDGWKPELDAVGSLLIAYDSDEEGQKGLHKMLGRFPNALDATLPELKPGNDLTDFTAAGGDLWEFVKLLLDKTGTLKKLGIEATNETQEAN